MARANYGIDFPRAFLWCLEGGHAGLLLAAVASFLPRAPVATILLHLGLWPGLCLVAAAFVLVYGSKVGKLLIRDRLLDALALRGDERLLDLGCGRGLLVLGAAKRLPRGRAVGLDLWDSADPAGNTITTAEANARAESVAERVELHTGDARQLPFPDASFDVVVSSWALHAVGEAAARRQALAEIVRVLKPGGSVALVDLRHTAEYVQALAAMGLADVNRRGPSFTFILPTFTVTGRKPVVR